MRGCRFLSFTWKPASFPRRCGTGSVEGFGMINEAVAKEFEPLTMLSKMASSTEVKFVIVSFAKVRAH